MDSNRPVNSVYGDSIVQTPQYAVGLERKYYRTALFRPGTRFCLTPSSGLPSGWVVVLNTRLVEKVSATISINLGDSLAKLIVCLFAFPP